MQQVSRNTFFLVAEIPGSAPACDAPKSEITSNAAAGSAPPCDDAAG